MILDNGIIRIEINERAQLTHLENRRFGGNVIAEPVSLFRAAILRTQDAAGLGDNKENMAFSEEQSISVREENGAAVICVEQLNTAMGVQNISVTLRVWLSGEHIRFGGEIVNESDSTLDELIYPCLGAVGTLGGEEPDLLLPYQAGQRYKRIGRYLAGRNGRENLHELTETYPGWLSMGFMALCGGNTVLSLSARDELFHTMSLRARGTQQGAVTLEANKMPFIEPGQRWSIPEFDVWLYQGSWRETVKDYARWAEGWRHPVEPADWMKHSNGYFLVINKQQFGAEAWPYETLPELYEHARAHGCDTLGLFGWYHTGHDNNYPDLDVSPTLGGAEGLRQGINAVQAAGGHVTLYYQGHLIDVNSPFYRAHGEAVEGKNIWGTPYYEFYPKACYSDALRHFSRKAFSTVCPSAPLWQEMMAKRLDWLASFGADGALYDQIGGMPPTPCFNKAHPHKNGSPALSYTQGRLELLGKIRARVAAHEDFAFMSEHITDLYSQYLDAVHGIASLPDPRGEVAVGPVGMPELFRYAFPKTMITVRNAQPFMDERMVNYALLYGFKFEMELRYDTDKRFIRSDAAPQRREYAQKAAALRRRFEKWLLLGEFCADEGVETACAKAGVFRAEDGSRAVVLWNDTDQAVRADVRMTQGRPISWATVDAAGACLPERLEANELVIVLIDEKN